MEEGSSTDPLSSRRRMLRGHQPARALLIDISHVVELKIWRRVLSALERFMAVVCNMAGPPRIPLITMYLLDSFPEVMLPFCPPKGNLCRVLSAVRDVRTITEDSVNGNAPRPTPCLSIGVMEACGQYSRHLNAMGHLQGRGNAQLDQLEVVMLSGASQSEARTLLDGLASQLDMTRLKRLVAALLTSSDPDVAESPHSSDHSNTRDSDDSGIVDFVFLDTDETSLQKFFYTWLMDSSSDSEHLHLVLPPASPADRELLIKCDLVERIVNPAQLPHHEFFNLHPDSAHVKMVFPCPSKSAGLTVPVYRLKVIATVPVEAVCDSVVFGLPLLAQATTCWRTDWEELEENSARFHSLSRELLNNGQVLLVKNHNSSSTPPTSTSSGRNQGRQAASTLGIEGMFILLPAPNNALLLKAVATRELMLPSAPSVGAGEVESTSLLQVQSSLTQVPSLSSYNPLSHSSCLVDVLLTQAAPKQQAVKPRPAAKRKAAPAKGSDTQDITWSGTTATVTSASGMAALSIGGRGRGDYSSAQARGGYLRPPGDAGRSHVTARRPDGFLIQLE